MVVVVAVAAVQAAGQMMLVMLSAVLLDQRAGLPTSTPSLVHPSSPPAACSTSSLPLPTTCCDGRQGSGLASLARVLLGQAAGAPAPMSAGSALACPPVPLS